MNIQPALDPLLTADTPATPGKGSLASVLVSTGHRECGPQGHPHVCPAQLSCCLGVETPLPPLPWMSCVLPSPQNPCLHAWDLSYQVCKMCRRGNHHLASSLLSLGIGSPWKGLSLRGQQSARPRGRSLRNIENKRGVASHAPEVHSRSSQSTSRGCESVHLFLSPKPGPFHPVLLNPACTPQSEGFSGIERRPRCPWRSLSQPPLLWCPRGVLPFAPAPSASTAPAPSVSVAGPQCFCGWPLRDSDFSPRGPGRRRSLPSVLPKRPLDTDLPPPSPAPHPTVVLAASLWTTVWRHTCRLPPMSSARRARAGHGVTFPAPLLGCAMRQVPSKPDTWS